MTDFRTFSGDERPPTWAEREEIQARFDRGEIDDVYVAPEQAPESFWHNMVQLALETYSPNPTNALWTTWSANMRWSHGWPPFPRDADAVYMFKSIVGHGNRPVGGTTRRVDVGVRLSAIEHFLDAAGSPTLDEVITERARWFRVGVILQDCRFVPLQSEHLHEALVRPTIVLLSAPALASVDAAYRKAFDRALGGDHSGAITAATGAVEEMLRVVLDVKGGTLDDLAKDARNQGIIPATVYQLVTKLSAFRPDSDAHGAGTDDLATAMLAIHITGSVLLYLAAEQAD